MSDEQGSLVRFRVLGAFSVAPAGRRFVVTPDTFAARLAEAELRAEVTVADRLGAAPERRFAVSFDKLASFRAADVVAASPELSALADLAESGGSPEDLEARVTDLVGVGKLSAAVSGEPAEPSDASTPVDAIFEAVDVKPGPAGAVDAFVRSVRPAGTGVSKRSRQARDAIEEAVYLTAGDILASDAVRSLESAWRGLKLLVDQCTAGAAIVIDVVDVSPGDVLAAAEAELPEELVDHPDAIVVVDPCSDIALLTELAALGERLHAPVIVHAAPAILGAADHDALIAKLDDDVGAQPPAWRDLRSTDPARWLCAVVNPFVAHTEGSRATRRSVLGSPALAVAALLAASFRDTRAFGRILGQPGSLQALATRELTSGRHAGVAVPTATFFSAHVQDRLATLGLTGLGSGRNTDRLILSRAVTASSATDAAPLPAQLMTGRIVRFCLWMREQVTADTSDEEVRTMFEQGAHVLLFAGLASGARLEAHVVREGDRRGLGIGASLRPELATVPFQMAFELPLP